MLNKSLQDMCALYCNFSFFTVSLLRIASGNILSEDVDNREWKEDFRNEGEPGQLLDRPKY